MGEPDGPWNPGARIALGQEPGEEMHERERLLRREGELQTRLAHEKQQERHLIISLQEVERQEAEWVCHMDTSMESVIETERNLGCRIERFESDNVHLKAEILRRSRENQQLADRLGDTMRHGTESEIRVQFLIDRIVALQSTKLEDPAQTESVINMRVRERDLLRLLEKERDQCEDVRLQNQEFATRLEEERDLSRKLQEQLQEVKDTILGRSLLGPGSLPPSSLARAGHPGPLGTDATPVEAPARTRERGPPPDGLPHTIREAEDPRDALALAAMSAQLMPPGTCGLEASPRRAARQPAGALPAGLRQSFGPSADAADRGFTPQQIEFTGPPSVEATLELERRLHDALDRVQFELPVQRSDSGVYTFGSDVTAVVQLTQNGAVVASKDGHTFEPIEDFVRHVSEETRRWTASMELESPESARGHLPHTSR